MDSERSAQIVPTLNHVIGQQRAVAVLRTALDAFYNERAKKGDAEAFPHVLMCGPAGTGKTLLSEIVARELCTNLHTELAKNMIAPANIHGLLMLLEPGDVIFLDEIHELPSASQVALYRALEERKVFLGGTRHVVTLPLFTLIGATTDEYHLTRSMRDRFRILLRLTHYSDEEIVQLVSQRAKRLGWSIDKSAVKGVASRSRGVPRLAVRLLESSKRVASAEGGEAITACHVERMCEIEGIDAYGLDPIEQQYLHVLREGQGPVRLNVIATHLGLPRRSIEAVFEADLIRLGLVTKSEKGRMLTAKGTEHLASIGR
jgi:Holliday junction DNA helicase RuvB